MKPVLHLPAHRRGLLLRLLVLVAAVVMAVGFQASEGQASPTRNESAPHESGGSRRPCPPEVPLVHPALQVLAQPTAALSRADSTGCSRAAASGAYSPVPSSM